ncbi:hypothetical protein [Nannocystis pusilla]|uniref:Secreted protein n=1 Tax=Nannocystis pusilla TaxID=889268 RepID=A0ABS7TQC3_9BACT|nr:hypothetical protein [Nannocystis pusilla]MBZ5710428.1 hypothetical protein [Nannocystis pusilla]
MRFKNNGLVMLPTSLFAVFAALAAPEYAGPRGPFDAPLALEPADWDAEFDEFEPADPDFKTFESRDDGLVERDNPHHPPPNSKPCKKKVNEPPGCPGNK